MYMYLSLFFNNLFFEVRMNSFRWWIFKFYVNCDGSFFCFVGCILVIFLGIIDLGVYVYELVFLDELVRFVWFFLVRVFLGLF